MITLFAADAEDYSTNGLLVLDHYCMSAVVAEEQNGKYELTVEIANSDFDVINQIQAGMTLRAPCPVREAPELANLETHKIYKTNATARLRIKASSSSKILKTLKKNTKVVYVETSGSWYKVTTMSGAIGYILTSSLTYFGEDIATAPGYQVVPDPSNDQLFDIITISHSIESVQITAQHVFYRLAGNLVRSLVITNTSAGTALATLLSGCEVAHDFVGYSDVATTATFDASYKSPIEALMGEEYFGLYGAYLLRDNFNVYLLTAPGKNRGASIAYRKNVTGMTVDVDASNLITRVLPIGYTKAGKPIYLDAVYVDSPHINDYPNPHIKVLDCKDIKIGSVYANTAAVKAKIAELAAAEFGGGADLPTVSVDVDVVDIDPSNIQSLRTIYLGDEVAFRHELYGFDFTLRVISYEWDALRGRYDSIQLGTPQVTLGKLRINPKLIPAGGVAGPMLAQGAVDVAMLSDAVSTDLDLSGNATTTSTQIVIESSAGTTLQGSSTSSTTTLTARAYRGGVEITDDLDASLFTWTRDSGDAIADAVWAADSAHIGVKSITVTANEFAISTNIYRCIIADESEA